MNDRGKMKFRGKNLFKGITAKAACCVLAAALAGCASTDTDIFGGAEEIKLETSGPAKLRQVVKMHERLDRVGGKLLIENANLCKKQLRNLLGFSVENRWTYSRQMADTAEDLYDLDDRLRIRTVVPGSGAYRAGLRKGDILMRIGTERAPKGVSAESDAVRILSDQIAKTTELPLTVQRGKSVEHITIPLTPACGFRIELAETADVSAYSDGNRILLTQGMLVFARTDETLAYVIAKEMAHNVLGHAAMLQNTEHASTIIDYMLQSPPRRIAANLSLNPMTKKYDTDADTLSLAMALRAGYRIDNAPIFWKKTAQRFPANSRMNYTYQHPETNARLEAMPKSVERIKEIDKRRRALNAPANPAAMPQPVSAGHD